MVGGGPQHHKSAPSARPVLAPCVLDLGTGNGSALFSLCLQGGYTGRMVGVDYSDKSIALARKLHTQYASSSSASTPPSDVPAVDMSNIDFHVLDIITDSPSAQTWWPQSGFDLVLDKGTFDAISLSSSTVFDPSTNAERRICELYPSKVLAMVKPDGFLLVTSCNWTETEVISWFTGASSAQDVNNHEAETHRARFTVYDSIKYPVFEFGGQKGQGVASVCFRRTCER